MPGQERVTRNESVSQDIPIELRNRARAAVDLVSTKTGHRYTLAQFMKDAISAQLEALAIDYNDGRPIEPTERPLPRGRLPKRATA